MLGTSMPPPAPAHADDPAAEPRSAPGGPLAWTATGLLLAAGVLGVAAVFPVYYRGGQALSAHADEIVQTLVVVLGWLGCATALALHRPAAAQAATWAAVGIGVTEGGLRLADIGQLTGGNSAGAGLWLLTAAWAAGAAGAVVAVVATHRCGGLGRPALPRRGATTGVELLLGLAVGVAGVLSAVAFVPSWDRYLVTSAVDPGYFGSFTLGDAFNNPGLAIAGNVVTAAALALLPLAALLWRPARVGAAVIAGTSVVLAAQVLSGAVQVLETPDPLQLLSPTDVRALQPSISLHLTGWFDAELAALIVMALLAAVRLGAHHHGVVAPGGGPGTDLQAWAGGPGGPGLPATGPAGWGAAHGGGWAPPPAPGRWATPQPVGGWTPPPATPPPGAPWVVGSDGGSQPVVQPGWAPPPAPPAQAGWGRAPDDAPAPSWGELPPPRWERPEHGGDR